MPSSRRRFVRTVAAGGVLTALSGCTSDPKPSTATPLPEPESNPAPATGDPITLSRDYRGSSKYDYYPDTSEVRRRTGYRKHVNESGTTKEPVYEREPASSWVTRVGGTVAGAEAMTTVRERLGVESLDNISRGIGYDDGEARRVMLGYEVWPNRSGETRTPSVEFEALVSAVPRTVTADFQFEATTLSATFHPVVEFRQMYRS
ncbi:MULTISPECIES: twin-arginine translocation signal domain-containing protein [unclassified Haloferax]|uniref:twin-arginine translocation signal domain-containing protein n=1 Tax=unclassified Haloferax TaxID=2625095 RepID=UPI00287640DD|nr:MULTISPECIES: twin-arginine translocation signal domain-containing protein [unclassified Haloferax]MDS0243016.1 twin-arginine translocation signal domain-containing protein [Haloferax sp. S2CR25]MDS0446137.1 twin-arginine translocation signal domain-containing protein [Haloferax sp. S2CR25-2]